MTPHISKWYKNKSAAVSLRFDDSTEDHVTTAIPLLDKYGLIGTFMINPGRRPYQKLQNFWENDFPQTGHSLGNHTWHHKGAQSLEEAEAEIASVSRLIRSLYPARSELTVFASGGGEKWCRKRWSSADPAFKSILATYHLIDLYDGHHRSLQADSKTQTANLCRAVRDAIADNGHQPCHFHIIGTPYTTVKGIARGILQGRDLAFKATKFDAFLAYLSSCEKDVWNAALIDILKYETEFNHHQLTVLDASAEEMRFKLSVSCDTARYDHPLTLVFPDSEVAAVYQETNGDPEPLNMTGGQKTSQTDVRPVDSVIIAKF